MAFVAPLVGGCTPTSTRHPAISRSALGLSKTADGKSLKLRPLRRVGGSRVNASLDTNETNVGDTNNSNKSNVSGKKSLVSLQATKNPSSSTTDSQTETQAQTQTQTKTQVLPQQQETPPQQQQQQRPRSTQPRKQKGFLSLVAERTKDLAWDQALAFQHTVTKPKRGVTRPRVVVLGSGWAAQAIVKTLDTTKYDLLVVSPRNYFVFTPMLASSSVGSVEFRSICQPIRQGDLDLSYYEAKCVQIMHEEKKIVCVESAGKEDGKQEREFEIPYSFLVLSVGAQVNTFGIPGVDKHLHFLKEIPDAQGIRRAIVDRFERAILPDTSDAERRRLLHFVVVGGGPTGVELCAEVGDLLKQDLARLYPKLVGETLLTLLEAGPSILMQFNPELQKKAMENLIQEHVDVRTGAMVTKVDASKFYLKDGTEIEYGLGVWAAGVGPVPLVKDLINAVPEQKEARGRLLTDEFMRVNGMDDVFALGDCAQIEVRPLPMTGQVASQQGTYFARLLNHDYNLTCELPLDGRPANGKPVEVPEVGLAKTAEPFQYLKLGTLAYVGGNKAISQVEAGDSGLQVNVWGFPSFIIWRAIYLSKLFSTKNRINVLIDWTRARIFGRDISQF